MDSIVQLLNALLQCYFAAVALTTAMFTLLMDNWAASFFVVFWLLMVRWSDLRKELGGGGGTALALLAFIAALTWGYCTSAGGAAAAMGIPSTLEKSLLVAVWMGVAFVCGHLQEVLNVEPALFEISGPPDAGAVGHDDHDGAHSASGHGHH